MPVPPTQSSAREALELEIGKAFANGRVYVSFSGGRDSSLVLAVAARVARRRGLPLPVPVSLRHTSPNADETMWQELVIRHLELDDWVVVDAKDDMDVLGKKATTVLRATGLLCPPNAYLHLPMLERAAGGTLLTGAGGDELLGSRASHLVRWRSGTPGAKRRRALQTAALQAAPVYVRRAWKRRELDLPSWLSPVGRELATGRELSEHVRSPSRWDCEAAGWARSRTVRMGQEALRAVAATVGVSTSSPLMASPFVDAFATEVGPGGPAHRTRSMQLLASDLLPEEVLDRRTKAAFGAMVWGPEFREFVASWAGAELASEVAELVDEESLLAEWAQPVPRFASMMLAQHAWLRRHGADPV